MEPEERNVFGEALVKPRVRWGSWYIALTTGWIVLGPIVLARGIAIIQRVQLGLFLYVGAATFGLALGAIQGLPITPHFLITIVDAGLYVVYATRMRCPCLHHCYECSEMHSRLRMLIVFTDDPMSFHEQLKGPSQTS